MTGPLAKRSRFGSLVVEGTRVRLSGQDSGRGTFSQRHAVLYDTQTGKSWAPLSELRSDSKPEARFEVFDSSLSEEGVLGFEYGYTVVAREALVMWEAQFGDFVNGAQTIIDQYIAASEDKWRQTSRLTMLLPHGYEGQGPEHSSARLERFLQLCAENNLQVCYPTTPAQYFHLLRRQVRPGHGASAGRDHAEEFVATSGCGFGVADFTTGGFLPVIDDAEIANAEAVERVVVCSGKVYYDLLEARKKAGVEKVAIVRLEQFYPFPATRLREILARYTNAQRFCLDAGRAEEHGRLDFCRATAGRDFAAARNVRSMLAASPPPVQPPALTRFIRQNRRSSWRKR